MKILTLCFPLSNGEILLGQKKRGFGVGKWNGFGGKVEKGETVEDAMCREVLEEAGIKLLSFKKVGVVWESHSTWPEVLEVHVFTSHYFIGVPKESEEMIPKWFTTFPFDLMWEGDVIWLPRIFSDPFFTLKVELNDDYSVRRSYETNSIVE